jgi:hypothetical protein
MYALGITYLSPIVTGNTISIYIYIYTHFVHLKTEGKPVAGNNICIPLHTISFFIETLVKIHFRHIDQT